MMTIESTSSVSISGWKIQSQVGGYPLLHKEYVENAVFVDFVNELTVENETLVIYNITTPQNENAGWPTAVISCKFSPHGWGFEPAILIVPETSLAFIGAGTTLLAYDLIKLEKLWEDTADLGFFSWERHGDVVIMSAEIELAAWSIKGEKLWTKFVEPPWFYEVKNGRIKLDVMGIKTTFNIYSGEG